MSNPPPRPALRKATDSGIHPAVPRGGLHAVPGPEPVPAPPTTAEAPRSPDHGVGADLSAAIARRQVASTGTRTAAERTPAWWPSGPANGDASGKAGSRQGNKGKATKGAPDRVKGKTRDRSAHKQGGKGKKGSDKSVDVVVVKVPMPADLHARLTARAAEHRLEPGPALVELSRVWLDG